MASRSRSSSGRRKSSQKPALSTSAQKGNYSWTIYNMLVATALISNAFAVIMNGLSLAAYQDLLTDATRPIRNSLIVGFAFGLFGFLWSLVLVCLVTRLKALRILSVMLGIGALVMLIAALAAGWFIPDPQVLTTYPAIGPYKGATVALYSVNIMLYFVLSLFVGAVAVRLATVNRR